MSMFCFNIKRLYSKFRNYILYGLFGGVAAIIDYTVFFLLYHFDVVTKIEVASLAGNVCGFIFTFMMNTFVNFNKNDRVLYRFFSYGIICALGSALSTVLLNVFDGKMNQYLLKACVMICVCSLQFVLNKLVTYNDKRRI